MLRKTSNGHQLKQSSLRQGIVIILININYMTVVREAIHVKKILLEIGFIEEMRTSNSIEIVKSCPKPCSSFLIRANRFNPFDTVSVAGLRFELL